MKECTGIFTNLLYKQSKLTKCSLQRRLGFYRITPVIVLYMNSECITLAYGESITQHDQYQQWRVYIEQSKVKHFRILSQRCTCT